MSKKWGRRKSDNRAYRKSDKAIPVSGDYVTITPPTQEKLAARQLLQTELQFLKRNQRKPSGLTMYPQEFFLEYGKQYNSKEKLSPNEVEELVELLRGRSPNMKECYYNAAMLAVDNLDYTYVEGYLASPRLPALPHAWVIDKKGRVIDITQQIESREGDYEKLRRGKKVKSFSISNNVLGHVPDGWEYYGVPIKTKFLVESMHKYEVSPPLVDYTHKFDILKIPKDRLRKEALA